MLSLFFEKCKVKKNTFTLFREVKSEIKVLRDRDQEVEILENPRKTRISLVPVIYAYMLEHVKCGPTHGRGKVENRL